MHNRKQFQVDRVAFFSDAVIAIAITLMVLEIKIPPIEAGISLNDLIAKYAATFLLHSTALFICFVTIGNLWIKHHDLYEHIVDYNKALIKSNLYFLLSIVLLPISISFLFEQQSPVWLKLFTYFLNLAICNLTYFLMLRVVFHDKYNFSVLKDEKLIVKNKRSTLIATVAFTATALLALLKISWFYVPLFTFVVVRIINRRIIYREKNNKSHHVKDKPHGEKVAG
ncbi:MAG TPA: TMEM175 family protein [Chitinophagaceae bacterium]|nr:TMEM175 family protein [Chitinophagaceae bacterium]